MNLRALVGNKLTSVYRKGRK